MPEDKAVHFSISSASAWLLGLDMRISDMCIL